MSLNRFISEVKTRGIARTNRYLVEFYVPGGDQDSNRLAQLFCDAAQLPSVSIASQPSRTYGENREIPYGERNYETITLSFYVDSDLKVKTLFDEWQNAIINPVTRHVSYYNNFITEMKISVVDLQSASVTAESGRVIAEVDNVPYSVTLYECWPKTIGAVTLDASSKDVMKLSVTLQYKYWVAENQNVSRNFLSVSGLPATGQADPQGVFTGTGSPFNPDVDVTEEMIIEREDISGL